MPSPRAAGLSRWSAVPLAFGSIAGSGILSLPSAVYAESGSASLLVWVVAAAACVPMLVMFRDAMSLSDNGNAIQTLVAGGLRPWVGAAMPLMFVCVVVVGLPAGCMVAGRYVEDGMGWPGSAPAAAAGILVTSLAANLLGGTVGRIVQLLGSAVLVATGIVLIASGASRATHPVSVVPDSADRGTMLAGALLAFWAFVGFENLTFLGRDLRDPRRDFFAVSVIALAIYGTFAVALTLTIAATVDIHFVDPVTGLLQIADDPRVQAGVAVVALAAMLINAAAWVRGVAQLIRGAAEAGQLPRYLAHRPPAQIALLACLFAISLAVLAIRPDLIVAALAASSAVFVLIYLTCIVAYLRVIGLRARTAANALLIPAMLVTLADSGSRSGYGLNVTAACLAWCYLRRSRTAPVS